MSALIFYVQQRNGSGEWKPIVTTATTTAVIILAHHHRHPTTATAPSSSSIQCRCQCHCLHCYGNILQLLARVAWLSQAKTRTIHLLSSGPEVRPACTYSGAAQMGGWTFVFVASSTCAIRSATRGGSCTPLAVCVTTLALRRCQSR